MDDRTYVRKIIENAVGSNRHYIDDPSEAPEGVEVQEGERGGTFWVAGGRESSSEEEGDDMGTEDYQPDAEEDISRFHEDEDATELIDMTNNEPTMGFTLHRNLEPQDLGDEDVWLVGMEGAKIEGELSKEDVVEKYEEYQDVLSDFTGVRIGGYHFEKGGTFSVDITAAVKDKEEAEQLGEELNQESIFNLGSEDLEMTGGDGDSPLEGPEDVRNVLEGVETLSEKLLRSLTRRIGIMKVDNNLTRYVNENGDEMNFYQIAMQSAKEGKKVEETEEGYTVDGVLYQPVEE